MLIIFPGTQSGFWVILFFLVFTLLLPLGKRKLALMVPCINYIENHFLIKKRDSREDARFTYKVTFLSGQLKVQKRPTFIFFLPQFIIDSGDSYVKAEKLSGKENGTFRQVWPAGALPLLKHTTLKKSAHRQFFIQI